MYDANLPLLWCSKTCINHFSLLDVHKFLFTATTIGAGWCVMSGCIARVHLATFIISRTFQPSFLHATFPLPSQMKCEREYIYEPEHTSRAISFCANRNDDAWHSYKNSWEMWHFIYTNSAQFLDLDKQYFSILRTGEHISVLTFYLSMTVPVKLSLILWFE